jgi:hypothetical protein
MLFWGNDTFMTPRVVYSAHDHTETNFPGHVLSPHVLKHIVLDYSSYLIVDFEAVPIEPSQKYDRSTLTSSTGAVIHPKLSQYQCVCFAGSSILCLDDDL